MTWKIVVRKASNEKYYAVMLSEGNHEEVARSALDDFPNTAAAAAYFMSKQHAKLDVRVTEQSDGKWLWELLADGLRGPSKVFYSQGLEDKEYTIETGDKAK